MRRQGWHCLCSVFSLYARRWACLLVWVLPLGSIPTPASVSMSTGMHIAHNSVHDCSAHCMVFVVAAAVAVGHCRVQSIYRVEAKGNVFSELSVIDRAIRLRGLLAARRLFEEWPLRLQVLKGVAAGIECLHNNGIVHRDLASRNVLLCGSEKMDDWTVSSVCRSDVCISTTLPSTILQPCVSLQLSVS